MQSYILVALAATVLACSPPTSGTSRGTPSPMPPIAGSDAGTTRPPSPPEPPAPPTPEGCDPGAYDEPGNGYDEDCDGTDALSSDCDVGLALASNSAEDAARAIGLCRFVAAGEPGWGVLSARFTTADGSGAPRSMTQVGLLPGFGSVAPPQGGSMLALSSGVARDPSQPSFTSDCDEFGIEPPLFPGDPIEGDEGYPPGFPTASPSCPGVRSGLVYNSVALEVRIRVPTNARGFRFNSNFFTYEYPNYICQEFNDFFATLRRDGDGNWQNIVFDTMGNAVSVNNSLLRVCEPGTHGGKRFECPLGRGMLASTGYDGSALCGREDEHGPPTAGIGGATGWLRTTAEATGGAELTLRFTIWDSGDPTLDSLTLVDGFEWELTEIEAPETVPDPLI